MGTLKSQAGFDRSLVLNQPRKRSSGIKGSLESEPIVSLLVGLILWEIIGRLVPVFIPPPSVVAEAWVSLALSGRLWAGALVSLSSLAIGYPLALVTGIGLGLLMGRYERLSYLLDFYINALMSTPAVALIPIFMIWFGLGLPSRVAVVFLFSFFVIVVNTATGVRQVPDTLIEMGHSFGASKDQIFSRIIFPAALPAIMAGVKLGLGRAVKGMVTAEMILALTGLGGMIESYGSSFAMKYVFAIALTIVLVTQLLMVVLQLLEYKFTRWRKTEQSTA